MGRIVREHYPVNKLPEDLRQGLAPDGDARVTVEEMQGFRGGDHQEVLPSIERPVHVPTLEELFLRRHPTFCSGAEVDAHVRALRDEWD